MKIFSLISLAAILSHLTPAIALSGYKCKDKVIGLVPIQQFLDDAFGTSQLPPYPGPRNKIFLSGGFHVILQFPSGDVDVKFEVAANSNKEVLYVKAFVLGEEIKCTPTNQKPDFNERLKRA
ncbi:unnamed protein product [Blumeria hordei]|uniref:Candidate secreted effector protein n=1 Tax=Blumeria hordei TaxID=2867405 RepID=A0A383V0H3_BLUHO|nr:unnamed protein product [Blumeria hordei]